MEDVTNSQSLLASLEKLGRPRVLVLGDLMLDRYTWGDAERVSQEAPVVLLRADHREVRLGGAANVCNMLAGLEASVACAGLVGDDGEGRLLLDLLQQAGIATDDVLKDPARPTTVKERFIGRAQGRHAHQMLRVDSEVRDPLSADLEAALQQRLIAQLDRFDVVLVSDYDKGVCTPSLLRALIAAARHRGMPLLVDPIRSADYSRYRGATTMTPNRLEAGLASGITIRSVDDAFQAGELLRRQLELDVAIVTLDRDGMALVPPNGSPCIFPTRPRAVYDITGAGDMALATIGVCAAARLSWPDALRLANVAAGLEVEKVGVAVVPRAEIRARLEEELAARTHCSGEWGVGSGESRQAPADPERKVITWQDAPARLAPHRNNGERIVFTNGCFDLLHVGHAASLADARACGDILVVGLNGDASVRRLKGSTRPIIGQADRAALLAALACVDYVLIFDEDTPLELIEHIRPDVLVKGGGYDPQNIVGRSFVEGYGGKVCATGMREGVSTSRILEQLAQAGPPKPHFASSHVRQEVR